MAGWMTIPTPPWHQDIIIDFPSMSWVAILGDKLLEPALLRNTPIRAVYHHFLVNDLPVILEYVLLHQRQHKWFLHDGAPPHFLRIFKQHLNQTFGEQWIGRGGPFN
jgi:hypothetical protein